MKSSVFELSLWLRFLFCLTYAFKGRKKQKPCNVMCITDLLSSGLHQERKYFEVQKHKVKTRFNNSSTLHHWKQ